LSLCLHGETIHEINCACVVFSGGETIREINRVSGARVEMSRDPPQNPTERVFKFYGSQEQIQAAVALVQEKAGLVYSGL